MRCLFSHVCVFLCLRVQGKRLSRVCLEFGVLVLVLCLVYVFLSFTLYFHLSLGLVSASLAMSFTLFPSLGVSICLPLDTYPSICPCLPLVLACLLFVAWFWVGWDGGFWLLCICLTEFTCCLLAYLVHMAKM